MNDGMIQINFKKIHLIVATIVLLVTLFTPFVTGFITISKNTEDIGRHDNRIMVLEKDKINNHDILLELKFNLRNHMIASGEEYIDLEGQKKWLVIITQIHIQFIQIVEV